MRILVIGKYPPIQGGVSTDTFWTSQILAEMGHQVCVLTSANEVEKEYRVSLSKEDEKLLTGFREGTLLKLHFTTVDRHHLYVPQGNPVISKIVSAGLEIIEEFRPDFVWSFYLEPFGVAALFLHLATGIPYTVRHAGTDFGRLFRTKQLQRIYQEVFRKALIVFSKKSHHAELLQIGVNRDRLLEPISPRLPGDIFYPEPVPEIEAGLRLAVYGKVGPSKGTEQLLIALSQLRDEGFPVFTYAHWGGRGIEKYLGMADKLGLKEPYLYIKPFIPQWKIGELIRSVHAVAFLENKFHIDFHAPGVPLEVNSCGRLLITTTEIAEKNRLNKIIEDNVTACVIPADPLSADDIISAVKRINTIMLSGYKIPEERIFDTSLFSAHARSILTDHLHEISQRL